MMTAVQSWCQTVQSSSEIFRSTQHYCDTAPFEVPGKTEATSESFWRITALKQVV